MNTVEESTSNEYTIVLDTGALLAKYYRYIDRSRYKLYTTINAISEVRDMDNKQALEEAIELGLLHTLIPRQSSMNRVINIAKEIGSLHKLSRTDIEIAALAHELRDEKNEVIVITDDYELQNLLFYMGIGFKPLRTKGITEPRQYRAQCPVCGYIPGKPGETLCPLCGAEIKRNRS